MQNDFEKSVQHRMDELKIQPSAELWQKIEPELPRPKKDRRWLVFLLFLLAGGAGLFTWHAARNNADQTTIAIAPGKPSGNQPLEPAIMNPLPGNNQTHSQKLQKLPAPNENSWPAASIAKTKKRAFNAYGRKKTNSSAYNPTHKRKKIEGTDSGQSRVVTYIPELTTDATADAKNDMPVPSNKEQNTGSIMTTPESANSIPDVAALIPAGNPTTNNKAHGKQQRGSKHNQKLQYGFEVGGGISTTKTGLFSSNKTIADNMSNSPAGGSPPPGRIPPANPRAGVSFAAGIKVQKKISPELSLHGGLQYNYYSNVIKTGTPGDTSGNGFFPGMAYGTTRFYRTGAVSNYRNSFHVLAVPIAIRYQGLRNVPAYVEAGMSVGHLLNTNALVYSAQNAAYATDNAAFNQWLISATGGLGIHLFAKRKIPITLGYRVGYSLNSVTKTSITRQHLTNSTLYVSIPFKK